MSLKSNQNRRAFLKMMGIGSIALLYTNPLKAFMTEKFDLDFAAQLQLIKNIRGFLRDILKMEIGEYFYTEWETKKGMLFYLYISEPNSIKSPSGMKDFLYFGSNETEAYQAADKYAKRGFHTLVYKTAGTSAALLNQTLLSYPLESITSIVLHEALHVHLRRLRRSIPIVIEEAACDVFANQIIPKFQNQTSLLNRSKLSKLIKVNERVYKTINKCLKWIESDNYPQNLVYAKCRKKLDKILIKGSDYQRDRFNYGINNAFLLRNSYYSKHYFLLCKLYKKIDNPIEYINFVASLPDTEETALSVIKSRLVS